jgi:hypothetical protein
MTYWDDDTRLVRGRVTGAEVKRDRYGNPYIEVELEPLAGAAAVGTGDEKSRGAERSA